MMNVLFLDNFSYPTFRLDALVLLRVNEAKVWGTLSFIHPEED